MPLHSLEFVAVKDPKGGSASWHGIYHGLSGVPKSLLWGCKYTVCTEMLLGHSGGRAYKPKLPGLYLDPTERGPKSVGRFNFGRPLKGHACIMPWGFEYTAP